MLLSAGGNGTDWTQVTVVVTLILAVAGYFTQGRRTGRDDTLKELRAIIGDLHSEVKELKAEITRLKRRPARKA